jgi:hypothetical protein
MERKVRGDIERRIFYPPHSWIPLHFDVIGEVFPELQENRSAQLYIALYERARRVRSGEIAMSIRELSELIDCDPRTARKCISELVGEGFVIIDYEGRKLRSRTNKTRFRVPLSELSLESGKWFPIPRFLVTDYLKAFPGSLLLIIVICFQHRYWKRRCWLSMRFLEKTTNWSRRQIYHALNLMGHEHKWKKLDTQLPWPLEITYSLDRESRRFSVRAVDYYRPLGRQKRAVGLSEEFATHFGFRNKSSKIDEETED